MTTSTACDRCAASCRSGRAARVCAVATARGAGRRARYSTAVSYRHASRASRAFRSNRMGPNAVLGAATWTATSRRVCRRASFSRRAGMRRGSSRSARRGVVKRRISMRTRRAPVVRRRRRCAVPAMSPRGAMRVAQAAIRTRRVVGSSDRSRSSARRLRIRPCANDGARPVKRHRCRRATMRRAVHRRAPRQTGSAPHGRSASCARGPRRRRASLVGSSERPRRKSASVSVSSDRPRRRAATRDSASRARRRCASVRRASRHRRTR